MKLYCVKGELSGTVLFITTYMVKKKSICMNEKYAENFMSSHNFDRQQHIQNYFQREESQTSEMESFHATRMENVYITIRYPYCIFTVEKTTNLKVRRFSLRRCIQHRYFHRERLRHLLSGNVTTANTKCPIISKIFTQKQMSESLFLFHEWFIKCLKLIDTLCARLLTSSYAWSFHNCYSLNEKTRML